MVWLQPARREVAQANLPLVLLEPQFHARKLWLRVRVVDERHMSDDSSHEDHFPLLPFLRDLFRVPLEPESEVTVERPSLLFLQSVVDLRSVQVKRLVHISREQLLIPSHVPLLVELKDGKIGGKTRDGVLGVNHEVGG